MGKFVHYFYKKMHTKAIHCKSRLNAGFPAWLFDRSRSSDQLLLNREEYTWTASWLVPAELDNFRYVYLA